MYNVQCTMCKVKRESHIMCLCDDRCHIHGRWFECSRTIHRYIRRVHSERWCRNRNYRWLCRLQHTVRHWSVFALYRYEIIWNFYLHSLLNNKSEHFLGFFGIRTSFPTLVNSSALFTITLVKKGFWQPKTRDGKWPGFWESDLMSVTSYDVI